VEQLDFYRAFVVWLMGEGYQAKLLSSIIERAIFKWLHRILSSGLSLVAVIISSHFVQP
jgi:hypothetical protein